MSLTVHFNGICTHIPGTGGMHRVLLVRADNGAWINDAPLPPHIPMLRIHPSWIKGIEGNMDGLLQVQAGLWRLCGVQVTLEGTATPQELKYDESFGKIPHMKMPADEEVPALSIEVIDKEQAACYVDLYAGTLFSQPDHDAVMGRLEVETTGAPVLNIRCFWNQSTTRIHLRDGAEVRVEHTGASDGDSDKDFLLHYRVFDWIHRDAYVPPKPKPKSREGNSGSFSIGCSNSQYP